MDLKAEHGVQKSLAKALSVEIRDTIHNQSEYEVLSKEDLKAIAERTATQQFLGCYDNQCLINFGKKIGTKYMVAGSISKLGEIYSVHLRLIDTKGDSAGVKKRVNKKCKCNEGELFNAAKAVAALVMGKKEQPVDITLNTKVDEPEVMVRHRFVYDYAAIGEIDGYDTIIVVKDRKTGLQWIAGPDRYTTWDEAKSWVENLNVSEGGWRMPTGKELRTLYKKGAGERNMTPILKTTGWWVWSGETQYSSFAWGFSFYLGREYYIDRNSDSAAARGFAVRSRR